MKRNDLGERLRVESQEDEKSSRNHSRTAPPLPNWHSEKTLKEGEELLPPKKKGSELRASRIPKTRNAAYFDPSMINQFIEQETTREDDTTKPLTSVSTIRKTPPAPTITKTPPASTTTPPRVLPTPPSTTTGTPTKTPPVINRTQKPKNYVPRQTFYRNQTISPTNQKNTLTSASSFTSSTAHKGKPTVSPHKTFAGMPSPPRTTTLPSVNSASNLLSVSPNTTSKQSTPTHSFNSNPNSTTPQNPNQRKYTTQPKFSNQPPPGLAAPLDSPLSYSSPAVCTKSREDPGLISSPSPSSPAAIGVSEKGRVGGGSKIQKRSENQKFSKFTETLLLPLIERGDRDRDTVELDDSPISLILTLNKIRLYSAPKDTRITLKIGVASHQKMDKIIWKDKCSTTLAGAGQWNHKLVLPLARKNVSGYAVFAVYSRDLYLGEGFCPLESSLSCLSPRREVIIHDKDKVFTSIGSLSVDILLDYENRPQLFGLGTFFENLQSNYHSFRNELPQDQLLEKEKEEEKNFMNQYEFVCEEIKKKPEIEWEKYKAVNILTTNCPSPAELPNGHRHVYQSHLQTFQSEFVETDESRHFRFRMHLMLEKTKKEQEETTSTNLVLLETTKDPLPENFPSSLSITFEFFQKINCIKSVRCGGGDSFEDAICSALMNLPSGPVMTKEKWAVKVCGKNEFLIDLSHKLFEIAHIRECVRIGEQIKFHIYPEGALALYLPLQDRKKFNRESLLDRARRRRTVSRTFQKDTTLGILQQNEKRFLLSSLQSAPLMVRILALEQFETRHLPPELIEDADRVEYFFLFKLMHGPRSLVRPYYSSLENRPFWAKWVSLGIPLPRLPQAATVSVTVYACRSHSRLTKALEFGMRGSYQGVKILKELNMEDAIFPLGHARFSLFDFQSRMRSGLMRWPLGGQNQKGLLAIEFVEPPFPVGWVPCPPTRKSPRSPRSPSPSPPSLSSPSSPSLSSPSLSSSSSSSSLERLNQLLERMKSDRDIGSLGEKDKEMLWKYRYFCAQNMPQLLPLIALECVDWLDPVSIKEFHQLLDEWTCLSPSDALHLLEAKFADSHVRHVAVRSLDGLSDSDVVLYLPQLLQVFKYELFFCSPLAEFLLLRAVGSLLVGHYFFWYVKSEMEMDVTTFEKFALLLDVYLSVCGEANKESVCQQYALVKKLEGVARKAKAFPPKKRKQGTQTLLAEITLSESIGLPIDPRVSVSALMPDKCKTMQSETVPIWLTFSNTDVCAPPSCYIFKVGDDLRKDILTLQMFRIMDAIWRAEGLDLHLRPYRVVATGANSGLIEVVPRSRTLADIHKTYGGIAAAMMKSSSLVNWLRGGATAQEYELKVQNFILSCAGYCVATYVLGIGDRHNDNIMVTDEGNLFHIDFSRMMGDVMKFAGVERETAPFVLTPDFVEVMGGPKSHGFSSFVALSCRAYNIVRKHANLIVSLFLITLETGIPRLDHEKDMLYLKTALQIGRTNEEAAYHFQGLIEESYENVRARLNFAVHILANPG